MACGFLGLSNRPFHLADQVGQVISLARHVNLQFIYIKVETLSAEERSLMKREKRREERMELVKKIFLRCV
jgi:hypothetical protein